MKSTPSYMFEANPVPQFAMKIKTWGTIFHVMDK